MKNKTWKNNLLPAIIILLIVACLVIGFVDHEAGISIGKNLLEYSWFMVSILPLVFILISLFDVWIEREKIERHLGEGGGVLSYLWILLLGATTVGPMLVSLPVAAALFRKGARLEIIFTYLGAASVCRIPMTLFEASCIGVKFTIIRYAVAIPLIIIMAKLFAAFLRARSYEIKEED